MAILIIDLLWQQLTDETPKNDKFERKWALSARDSSLFLLSSINNYKMFMIPKVLASVGRRTAAFGNMSKFARNFSQITVGFIQ